MPGIPKDYDHRASAFLIISPRRGIAWIRIILCHDKEQPAGNPKADDNQVKEYCPRAKRPWPKVVPRDEAGNSVPHSNRKRYSCLHQYYHHVRLVRWPFGCVLERKSHRKKQVLTMPKASPLWPRASFLVTYGTSASSGLRTAPCHLLM